MFDHKHAINDGLVYLKVENLKCIYDGIYIYIYIQLKNCAQWYEHQGISKFNIIEVLNMDMNIDLACDATKQMQLLLS